MPEQNEIAVPVIAEYPAGSGKYTICLNPGQKFPFAFGLAKAKMIRDNYDEIIKFIEDHDK